MPKLQKSVPLLALAFSFFCCAPADAHGQPLGTEFTYQGELSNAGTLANGLHDLQFRLYSAAAGGPQVGATQCADNVSVVGGRFVVTLDFGPQFAGQQRFLEIDVRADTGLSCADGTGFTTLGTRQALTASPNALFALSAASATTATTAATATTATSATTATTAATATNSTRLNGQLPAFYQNAANLGSGTLSDLRLSSNIATLASAQTFSASKVFAAAPAFTAAGAPFSVTDNTVVANLNADLLDGLHASSFLQFVPVPLLLSGAAASPIVRGENTSATNGAVGVSGISTGASGRTFGVIGQSASNEGTGVYGTATGASGSNYGGYFSASGTFGVGVSGEANSPTGSGVGVYGNSFSPTGVGVKGNAGRLGTDVSYGGLFTTFSSSGRGVQGTVLNDTGAGASFGVYGLNYNPSGTGVWGHAIARTGNTVGVKGQSDSSTGLAGLFTGKGPDTIYIENTDLGRGVQVVAPFNTAVWALTTSGFAGVDGRTLNSSGYAVLGINNANNGNAYGVVGQSGSATGWAVYAFGRTGASGTKSFRIDHPDDPENKYLLHYSAESPDVINFYSETVTLDERGEAIVELPAYFAKINTRPRYQLTAVGAPMPLLHIAEKISEASLAAGASMEPADVAPVCSFRIAGGAPGGEVSWEVKAVRNDRWMQQRGAPVETDKPGREKGLYQHPELYGQPAERGVHDQAQKQADAAAAAAGRSSER